MRENWINSLRLTTLAYYIPKGPKHLCTKSRRLQIQAFIFETTFLSHAIFPHIRPCLHHLCFFRYRQPRCCRVRPEGGELFFWFYSNLCPSQYFEISGSGPYQGPLVRPENWYLPRVANGSPGQIIGPRSIGGLCVNGVLLVWYLGRSYMMMVYTPVLVQDWTT